MKKLKEKSGRARGPDRRLLRNFRAAKLRCSAAESWIAAEKESAPLSLIARGHTDFAAQNSEEFHSRSFIIIIIVIFFTLGSIDPEG